MDNVSTDFLVRQAPVESRLALRTAAKSRKRKMGAMFATVMEVFNEIENHPEKTGMQILKELNIR
jgi:hypothetical protein